MTAKSVKDLPIENKRVLLRVDFNVPLAHGIITDATRIEAALPTIKYILSQGGKLILMSHLGRPKGSPDPKFSLKPCVDRLAKLLNCHVLFAPDCVGPEVKKLASNLNPSSVLLLENLRFHKGEEDPEEEPEFAEQLAQLGDLYVNDAFGTAHRQHASTYTIAKHFKGRCGLGFLMEKEVKTLTSLLTNPTRPFYAIVGGAKVGSKIGVLQSLLEKVEKLFIGGGMAYTFLHTQGVSIGNSIYDAEHEKLARDLLEMGKTIELPQDIVITNGTENKVVTVEEGIPDGWEGMDIGPATLKSWQKQLSDSKTVFWNGPVGVFEKPAFAEGTAGIAKVLASLNATTVAGGGDSAAAIQQSHLADRFTHISTGGGACLEFIEKGTLPSLESM